MPYKDLEKQKAAQRAYYERNKNKVLAKTRDRRNQVVKFLQELKQSTGCVDCKIMYPYWILQFDHRPDEEKLGNLSSMHRNVSFEVVKQEILKCDIVCANCHADRTHGRITTSGSDIIQVIEYMED